MVMAAQTSWLIDTSTAGTISNIATAFLYSHWVQGSVLAPLLSSPSKCFYDGHKSVSIESIPSSIVVSYCMYAQEWYFFFTQL